MCPGVKNPRGATVRIRGFEITLTDLIAWALILAEIAPDRTDAVLARGWEFGQSRAVCNVHWQSDVTQGRVIGATLVARLHANEEFRADLKSAREEIVALRARELPQSRDCEAEARALAVGAPARGDSDSR